MEYFQSVSQTEDLLDTSDSVQDLSPTSTSTESTESAGQGDDSRGGRRECTSPSPKKSRTDSVPNSHDLARYIGRPMCLLVAEKYELLTNPFRPVADYKFPKSTTGRALSFQHRWMQLHPWLAYSEQKMVVSALLVFYLLHLDTMDLIPVSLCNVP